MSSPKKPSRKKLSSRPSHEDDAVFQTTSAQLHGTIGASRSTNFSFKKDFVKDSMVVLGPERTFKLRNPLVLSSSSGLQQQSSGLLHAMDDGTTSIRGASISPFNTTQRIRSGERAPSTSSYSLSSYDDIVRDASKNGRRWPSNHCFCLLGTLFLLGTGLAFGIYYGLISNKQEKLVEFVYRGSFRIAEGDWFEPNLADVKGAAFSTKARDFEAKLDDLFKNSTVRDIYHHSEILTFQGNEDYDLSVFFNLYCVTKKTANDASEMESILREELAGKFPVNVHIDPSSVEVKARAVAISPNESSDLVDRRTDIDSASEGTRPLESDLSNFIPPYPTHPPSHGVDSAASPGIKKGQQSRPLLTSSTIRPAVTSPGPLIPISKFSQSQDHQERSGCVPISLNFCRHLAYNFTSFPDLLGHRGAREVDRLNEAAKLLVESECSPYIQHVLCHILQPPCDPDAPTSNGFVPPYPLPLMPFARIPNHLPPCRSLCMAVMTSCKARLGLSQQISRRQDVAGNKLLSNEVAGGLKDLLRCELFPIDDGMDSCTTKPSMNYVMEADPSECVRFMTANGQTGRICDGLMDCHDFSDEVACNYCPEGQVHCGVGASCIDVNKRCDGIPDCPNGSDERGCLTVAPDMAAANFVHQYFHEGYIVFTEGNNTGKICVDSLNSSSLMSTARQQSFLEIFGESACRSMSYRIMERIEIRIDNEHSADYAHLTEPIRWRATFLRAPCRKRQVLYLSCSGLECGNRPVHMHPDRPGTDLTLLPSAHGDWPWFAALIRDGVHACDATLVADQWLLTASSCFDGQNRAHWVARFAAVRLTSDAPWEQERRIIGMVKSPMKGNQLVLIKMETPVIYSDFVRPVCLARDHEAWISSPTSRCLFLGWGKDRDNLHEVTAKVVQNQKCDNVTTLCADVISPLDTCRNDEFAGSPLLCQLNDGRSWSLVGISNENRHCDRSFDDRQLDRVYLGVSSISDWVMQTNPLESMVSLSYRTFANYIVEDNLIGLRVFLENRHVVVDDRNENGATALVLASIKGKSAFVKELLAHGADPNAEDSDNWTPLLCAAKENFTSICVELLNHGADIEHRDMGGWTALLWASYKGYLETARLLIEQRAEVNVHGQFHITPLMWAAGRGHVAIVRLLLENGAKVNAGDKYGTTALIWACRKSHGEIVDMLLQAGANVEVSGMHCWTPLLLSAKENAADIVNKLLDRKPNVNATDKDGCAALTLACKEGYYDICMALLNAGAYVNLQDRSGDTNLIHAAKAGHKSIVEALLKKYADVDMTGKERKTALYWAVEKNHVSVVKSLLNSDPNLEISTKEGDTPLLRAVRNRSIEIVQLLLDKKARVTAADKEGDTVLHIAMRARSKAIVEVLLRNPKHSQLLYRPNRSGETPYNIDISQQKTILGQIFGARRLNTNEDNENMLGYELYSSALADMLSEPSLSMPITVGLYAKWGSGKSFLLSKLRDEMKGFARQWIEPQLQFSVVLSIIVLHIATLLGVIMGVSLDSWIAGLATGGGCLFLIVTFLYIVYWGSERFSWNWAHSFGLVLARKLEALKLVLQVTFCTPPGPQWGGDSIRIQPIRFYFTDQTKVSRSTRGENSVVQMIGSLLDSIEGDYGVVATRLYRAFRPKPLKSTSPWKFRRFCCIPYAAIFLICIDILLAGLVFLAIYQNAEIEDRIVNSNHVQYTLIAIGVFLGVVIIANGYTWGRIVKSLLFSQRRKLLRIIGRLQSVRAEGYLQALKREVAIMVEMVRCLDAYSGQQTRLVMVVDGLDSCEQDQVLYVLDAVHLLFTEQSSPFITLLAIDPHIIIKAIELNLHRMFNESNIGGHDYLRNLVHVPFFLQNAGLRKVKAAQQAALMLKNPGGVRTMVTSNSNHAAVLNWLESEDTANNQPAGDKVVMSPRRMSVESSAPQGKGLHRNHKLSSALPPAMGHRKLRPSESMESGLAMGNNNRVMAAQDLTKVLLTDDYFSDVNPRSMRRLMNVIYVTGRLLKAFQIEFNWYHLASWVNITEQWPYRTSWIILYCEVNEDKLDDLTTLKVVYERAKPFIPVSKEIEPHLEIDRDEKKFQTFLSFHRNTLQVLHLKMFMPFTIHLDPYLRKVIKEERSSFMAMQSGAPVPHTATADVKVNGNIIHEQPNPSVGMHVPWSVNGQPWTTVTLPTPDQNKPTMYPKYPSMVPTITHCNYGVMPATAYGPAVNQLCLKSTLPSRLQDRSLSSLTAEEVSELLRHLDGFRTAQADQYTRTFIDNNISGRVLLSCNLDELKALSGMSFGDWELFRVAVCALREREFQPRVANSPNPQQATAGQTSTTQHQSGNYNFLDVDFEGRLSRSSSLRSNTFAGTAPGEVVSEVDAIISAPKINTKRQTNIEKQVTLEDQAICGALQTLNEEAMEDVLDEREAEYLPGNDLMPNVYGYNSSNLSTCSDPTETDVLYLQTSVVPDLHFPALRHANSVLGSRGLIGNEDSVSLGSSLVSLAERGTVTPARQRTITEVVWPEQIASALNSGLRSRLSSSTSLFRAGSQKSILASDASYALSRRDSQRSVSDVGSTKPIFVSVDPSNIAESSCPVSSGFSPSVAGGWRSEQGSPRRPASLVFNETVNPTHDWLVKPVRDTPESPTGENRLKCTSGDRTPTASSSSPIIVHKRFSTTNVELLPDQIAGKLQPDKMTSSKSALRSPSKQRARRTGHHQSRTHVVPSPGLSTSRHPSGKSSDDTDEDGEDAPLMAAKEYVHHVRRVLPKATVLAIKESRPLSANSSFLGNYVQQTEGGGVANTTSSQLSLASPIGSSTSSLDSPLDTTDNEVYKTVIPKGDSSRRENSLALMLNRAINEIGDTGRAMATPSKPEPSASSEMETAN